MVKRILAVLVLASVILIPCCTKDKYSGEFKNDEEVAEYVETITNKKYSRTLMISCIVLIMVRLMKVFFMQLYM